MHKQLRFDLTKSVEDVEIRDVSYHPPRKLRAVEVQDYLNKPACDSPDPVRSMRLRCDRFGSDWELEVTGPPDGGPVRCRDVLEKLHE